MFYSMLVCVHKLEQKVGSQTRHLSNLIWGLFFIKIKAEKKTRIEISQNLTIILNYMIPLSIGFSGVRMAMKTFPPTRGSFSAFRFPVFHRRSSVQVKKCCQTSDWDKTGWRQTRSTKLCSWFIRCSIKSSSYRPKISLNLNHGMENSFVVKEQMFIKNFIDQELYSWLG